MNIKKACILALAAFAGLILVGMSGKKLLFIMFEGQPIENYPFTAYSFLLGSVLLISTGIVYSLAHKGDEQ